MEDRADRSVAGGKNRPVKASSAHGAAACNETTTILDYPSGEGRFTGDPYARDVRPEDVTVTPPSG